MGVVGSVLGFWEGKGRGEEEEREEGKAKGERRKEKTNLALLRHQLLIFHRRLLRRNRLRFLALLRHNQRIDSFREALGRLERCGAQLADQVAALFEERFLFLFGGEGLPGAGAAPAGGFLCFGLGF